MKHLVLFLLIIGSSFCSFSQELAISAASQQQQFYSSSLKTAYSGNHHESTIGNIGTWIMLGGAVITIAGYTEYKSATKTSGPFTFVDQSKQNAGQALEILGGVSFVTGLTMVIIGSINKHSSHHSKVGIISSKSNEMGIAYNFR